MSQRRTNRDLNAAKCARCGNREDHHIDANGERSCIVCKSLATARNAVSSCSALVRKY